MMAADFDLRTICNALASISAKWFVIGIQLGVPRNQLQVFRKEDDPLSAVVDYCLKGNTKEPLTWKSIATALRSNHVGESGLADKIDSKCCHNREGIQHSNEKLVQDGVKAGAPADFVDGGQESGVRPSLHALNHFKWLDDTQQEQTFRLEEKVCAQWKKFGILLDLTVNRLDAWKQESLGNAHTCWNKVMAHWLQGGNPRYPNTWEGLYQLLKDLQFGQIATELEQAVHRSI